MLSLYLTLTVMHWAETCNTNGNVIDIYLFTYLFKNKQGAIATYKLHLVQEAKLSLG